MGTRIFLGGDVMTGRGVDQILARSCSPELYEPYVRSAVDYVRSAEAAHGSIPRGAAPAYVWGEALPILEARAPDLRIVNLETSVTTSEAAFPKGINYRMHPGNVDVLTAARIDACVLANNHVLDWGVGGLVETLETLEGAGIRTVGAGRDADSAADPAVFEVADGSRVLVFAFCGGDSGVPATWAAGPGSPGVNRLPDFSRETAERVSRDIGGAVRPGDTVIVSVHWGENWGYRIPEDHLRFARALVEGGGVDLIHGHSSHHPKAFEAHRDRLVLYGCGDLVNDYEGIAGHGSYRDDLVLLHLPTLTASGALCSLELIPLQIRNFQLVRPVERDRDWLFGRLRWECARFGTGLRRKGDVFVLEG